MKIIVGLGNPGEQYQNTRHNIGFMVLDQYVRDKLPLSLSLKAWRRDERLVAEICKIGEILIVKPQTFMNSSGIAVKKILQYNNITIQQCSNNLFAIHDDIDLPLGKIRLRQGGASAGHHGIDSIIKELGSADFVRFRLGIGRGKLDVTKSSDVNLHQREIEKFVLSPFGHNETSTVKRMIKKTSQALEIALKEGLKVAKNRLN